MDALPPNDPNRNNNNNSNNSAKQVPSSGGPRRRIQRNGNVNRQDQNGDERGEMEIFGGGNMGDELMVAAMVLMGAAAFLLRERCIC